MGPRSVLWATVALTWVPSVVPQFEEHTQQYSEIMAQSTEELKELLMSTEDVEDYFYPARSYFNRDQYTYDIPHPQLYAIGLIVDPCVGNPYDCCTNMFGRGRPASSFPPSLPPSFVVGRFAVVGTGRRP